MYRKAITLVVRLLLFVAMLSVGVYASASGDVNEDGEVNSFDLLRLGTHLSD